MSAGKRRLHSKPSLQVVRVDNPSRHSEDCRHAGDRALTAFTVVKFVHILSAITAVGLNISYGVWIARAKSDPANVTFALKGIKFLDDRIANPAYGVLLLTGLLMVFLLPYPITTFWIDVALVLYAVMVVLALTQYTPTLRDQIKLAEGGDTTSAEFMRMGKRGQILGQVLAVLVILILVMMVFKPSL
jgi:uncharacterized membrane protein